MKTSERKYGRCMYFVSNAFARKMERLASDSWAPFDLSPSHAYLLMLVVEQPGIQPTAISEELQLSPSTITRLLEKLEEKKLLQRRMTGKISNIFPTAKAKKQYPEYLLCATQFSSVYEEVLGEKESAKLVQGLGTMTDKMK